MRRVVTLIVLIAFLYCQCAPRYYAGYHKIDAPIIISDVVGEVIDAEERSRYALFQGIDDFEQARFYAIEEGGLCAEIQTALYTMVSVNREPQMHMILKEYFEEYEWVQSSKEHFERKWQIVDNDVLGFPITQGEVSRFSNPMAACGFILGTAGLVTGVFWIAALFALFPIYTYDWEEQSKTSEKLFIIGGVAGVVAGGLTGFIVNSVNKRKALDTIRESRMPRVVD
jgi:hypothetical protein